MKNYPKHFSSSETTTRNWNSDAEVFRYNFRSLCILCEYMENTFCILFSSRPQEHGFIFIFVRINIRLISKCNTVQTALLLLLVWGKRKGYILCFCVHTNIFKRGKGGNFQSKNMNSKNSFLLACHFVPTNSWDKVAYQIVVLYGWLGAVHTKK